MAISVVVDPEPTFPCARHAGVPAEVLGSK